MLSKLYWKMYQNSATCFFKKPFQVPLIWSYIGFSSRNMQFYDDYNQETLIKTITLPKTLSWKTLKLYHSAIKKSAYLLDPKALKYALSSIFIKKTYKKVTLSKGLSIYQKRISYSITKYVFL